MTAVFFKEASRAPSQSYAPGARFCSRFLLCNVWPVVCPVRHLIYICRQLGQLQKTLNDKVQPSQHVKSGKQYEKSEYKISDQTRAATVSTHIIRKDKSRREDEARGQKISRGAAPGGRRRGGRGGGRPGGGGRAAGGE